MILVTGGMAQGKRSFVERELAGEGPVLWVDGAAATAEELCSAAFCFNFHAFVRRVLSGEVEADLNALVERLLAELPERVIIADQIGCGIVPLEREERLYREETGRACCRLAAGASQVWLVTCGIGRRIK